ncbi:hypothetical protein [Natronorubrum halalkaliphilum]|nr:hypothetical protein [Natronorubrum halalkaliphilum]
MALDEILNGDQITGRQAAMIFFAWLMLVIAAGFIMLLYTSATIG